MPKIIFRVSDDELEKLAAQGELPDLPLNAFCKEVLVNFSPKKTLLLKPESEMVRQFFENQLSDLKTQLTELQAGVVPSPAASSAGR